MIDIDSKIQTISEYLSKCCIDIGDKSLDDIKTAISLLKELPPSDAPNTFNREQRLISVSDEISWIIMSLKRRKSIIDEEIKKIKVPEYTLLVRQGRPSSEAINMEILFKHDELNQLNNKLEFLDNLLEYLMSIQENISRYIWMLRDRLQFLK